MRCIHLGYCPVATDRIDLNGQGDVAPLPGFRLKDRSYDWPVINNVSFFQGTFVPGIGIIPILTNPFYIGIIRIDGKEYAGKQPKLISEELFNAVQAKLSRRRPVKYRKHNSLLKDV